MNESKSESVNLNFCQGHCSNPSECKGEIYLVEVFDFEGQDESESWGTFRYCEQARKIDESNGFFVKIIK